MDFTSCSLESDCCPDSPVVGNLVLLQLLQATPQGGAAYILKHACWALLQSSNTLSGTPLNILRLIKPCVFCIELCLPKGKTVLGMGDHSNNH